MKSRKKWQTTLQMIAIPVLYALLLRFVFGYRSWSDLFSMMSVTFLFLLPSAVGALTVYFSSADRAGKFAYRFFVPWIPIFVFFFITLAFAWEGWPCLIMILPVFLLAASLGGLLGGYLKSRKRHGRLHLSLWILMPILASPAEQYLGTQSTPYQTRTYIDIQAPAGKIWSEVTRVREIKEWEDRGWLTRLLHFPRPVKAELNYEGLGASREAIFTHGLIFHETVTHYTHRQKMSFRIRALPHEIPLTTMDEHLVIGGKYFDVLNGTYELEKRNGHTYRLHLRSEYKLNTSFNFYAAWWAGLIMNDIQQNILQIEKKRAEGK